MSQPFTSIVLTIHNAASYAQACLDTLFAHTEAFHLIVVDDFSTDVAAGYWAEGIHKRQPVALYVRTGKQRWFTRASNLGLRLVRTERAILLNSDTVLDNGWLEELYAVWDVAAQELKKPIGLVGSVQSGEEQRRWAETIHPGYVTGHCWLLSMSALYDVSAKRGTPGIYLDETSAATCHIRSDNELCQRLNENGYATVMSFKSAVGHHGGKSWGHSLASIAGLRPGNFLTGDVEG